MDLQFHLLHEDDINAVVELSVLAWEPVFTAWERILGPDLYPVAIYPDWRKSQAQAVEKVCRNERLTTWVAVVEGRVVGFISYEPDVATKVGEVHMLAVHPDYQNRGIGTELNLLALQKLKEAGMKVAALGTGGDEGHAPARRTYEKVGYKGLPLVRYYKAL